MNEARIELIRNRITAAIQPAELDIVDESHLHVGHAGAKDGKGHFRVHVVAEKFAGLPTLQRHRLIYDAVKELMETDIHALSIEAKEPGERPS